MTASAFSAACQSMLLSSQNALALCWLSRTRQASLEQCRKRRWCPEKDAARKKMVPRRGLEPPRCYPLLPESSASTNSATWAIVFSCWLGAALSTGFLGQPALPVQRSACRRAATFSFWKPCFLSAFFALRMLYRRCLLCDFASGFQQARVLSCVNIVFITL